jgi:hypothetical protein
VPVIDLLALYHQTGYFRKTDFCATPIYLKVKPGKWILLCHIMLPSKAKDGPDNNCSGLN